MTARRSNAQLSTCPNNNSLLPDKAAGLIQLSPDLLGGGTIKAVAASSLFLKERGNVPAVLNDYAPYVEARFVRTAPCHELEASKTGEVTPGFHQ